MKKTKRVWINVFMAPCHNRCRHCYVLYRPEQFMATEDCLKVCSLFRDFCNDPDSEIFKWDFNPFMDFLDHPEVIRIAQHLKTLGDPMERVPSDAYRIAHEDRWQEFIQSLKYAGISEIHTTLYGMEETHDWFARRRGTFRDMSLGIERLINQGVSVKWRIMLHKKNLDEITKLLHWIEVRTGKQNIMDYPLYVFVGYGKEITDLRLEQSDLAKLSAEVVSAVESRYRNEKGWIEEIRNNTWPYNPFELKDMIVLDIDVQLDVRGGTSSHGVDGFFLGNLRVQSVAEIINNYKAHVLPGVYKMEEKEKIFIQNMTSFVSALKDSQSDKLYSKYEIFKKWEMMFKSNQGDNRAQRVCK